VTRTATMRAAHPEVAALVDRYRDGITAFELRDLAGTLIAGKPIDDAPPAGCVWIDADKLLEQIEHDRRTVERRR
jgi:hypothetical protein